MQPNDLKTGVVLSEALTIDREQFLREMQQDPELESCQDLASKNLVENELLYCQRDVTLCGNAEFSLYSQGFIRKKSSKQLTKV